jgi:hypothetical protein
MLTLPEYKPLHFQVLSNARNRHLPFGVSSSILNPLSLVIPGQRQARLRVRDVWWTHYLAVKNNPSCWNKALWKWPHENIHLANYLADKKKNPCAAPSFYGY